ncbi:MAG: VCBS repeat-containing protein, partial [Bacteroidales bacterium]|nr:VCBS repeat-containing protein [Bacteroidales bacterium]
MKKKYLFVNGFQKWNSLVYKFYKLYKRMRLLHSGNKLTEREYSRLNEKMKKLYKRLEKMQYKVGIRIAGTALAIMLSASVGQAQNFASPVKLQGISKDINVTGEANPVFADVDGDGDTDLFTGNTYGEILFYNNDGNGVYTAQGNLQADGSDINLGTVASPKFADLDGDGDLDLYIGDTDGKIRYYENDGTGTFSYIGFLQADAIDIDVNGTAKFAFEDIDGDNDLDLFIGDYYSGGVGNKYGYIKYYQNDGNGVFTANGNLQANGSDIHIDSSVNPNVSPAFADTDKDGDSDLYIASDNMNVIYYENDGTGTFAAGTNMQADDIDIHTKFAHPSIDFADINGDGNEDLF